MLIYRRKLCKIPIPIRINRINIKMVYKYFPKNQLLALFASIFSKFKFRLEFLSTFLPKEIRIKIKTLQ